MRIITDSGADLTPEDQRLWDITVVPLMIQFPDGEASSTDLTPDEFYNKLRSIEPKLPTTSQPSVGQFAQVFEQVGDGPILVVSISSGLSGTIRAARTAAQSFPNVTIYDAMTLSAPLRFQVLVAAMAAKKKWPLEAIITRLEAIRAANEAAFTADTLDYLIRGGRIGRVQAIAGSILKIKPIITVDKNDGKYTSMGRGRTLQQAMDIMIDKFLDKFGNKPLWVTTLHGQMPEKVHVFTEMVKQKLNVAKLETIRISPALGVHVGPNMFGAGVVPMELIEDLQ